MIVIDMHMLICTHLCLQDMFSNTPRNLNAHYIQIEALQILMLF
jgi:hypothetical protein